MEGGDRRRVPLGLVEQSGEVEKGAALAWQQALSAQPPLDPQNLMLGPSQQPEDIPKNCLAMLMAVRR